MLPLATFTPYSDRGRPWGGGPMDEETILNELPAGWKLLKIRPDGTIEVASDSLNVVIQGQDWTRIKQRMTSMMLSHR
jgi:hypothetical protein